MEARVVETGRRSPGAVGPNVDVGQLLAIARALVAVGAAVLYGIVWVAYEEFYGALGVTPDEVGLAQPTIISRAAVLLGVIFSTLAFTVGFGLVAYRLSAPILATRRGLESWVLHWSKVAGANIVALAGAVVVPVVLLRMFARGPSVPILASLIITTGGLALEMGWLLGDPDVAIGDRTRRMIGRLYPNRPPRVAALLVTSGAGILMVAWASNLMGDAAFAGKKLRATGVLPQNKVSYLNVDVAPARIYPKGEDVLRVCDGSTKAILLRRHDDVVYVLLLRGGTAADGVRSEVVRLHEDDYGVVDAPDAITACNRGSS